METRALGRSGLEVSVVGLGAWALGGLMWGGTDERQAEDAVRASLDEGVTLVDTAPAYGCGRSEEIVGRALAGRRDEVLVATKCGLRWDREDGALRFDVQDPERGGRVRMFYNLRPDSLREECEASLRRLCTDRIDLYLVHWPYPPHPLDEALAALVALREAGKVRTLGVSNFTLEQAVVAHREAGIACVQPPFSLLDRRCRADLLPWCLEEHVGVTAYSPMARGLLTGAVPVGRRFARSDHRAGHGAFEARHRRHVAEGLEAAREVASAHGVSLANLAVAWVLGEPGISCALVGARSPEQARENARAAALRLSAQERARLEAIFPELPWSSPLPGLGAAGRARAAGPS